MIPPPSGAGSRDGDWLSRDVASPAATRTAVVPVTFAARVRLVKYRVCLVNHCSEDTAVPSRLQLLVVFWCTGAAGIFLTQALVTGDPLTLLPALVLTLVACLGAMASYWIPPCQRLIAAMDARIGPASRATSKRAPAVTR